MKQSSDPVMAIIGVSELVDLLICLATSFPSTMGMHISGYNQVTFNPVVKIIYAIASIIRYMNLIF